MLHNLREWRTPVSKLISTNQDKRKCPEFLFHFKVQSSETYRRLLSSHPGSLACSQLSISGSLLKPANGARVAMGHAAAKGTRSHVPGRECVSAPAVNHQVGNRAREAPS